MGKQFLSEGVAQDIVSLLEAFNKFNCKSDLLVPIIEEVPVYWDGDRDCPAGTIKYNEDYDAFVFVPVENGLEEFSG